MQTYVWIYRKHKKTLIWKKTQNLKTSCPCFILIIRKSKNCRNYEVRIWRKSGSWNLGDENVRLGLANATTAIFADEVEASDVGGADLPVATGAVGHPFSGLGAHCATIVHGFFCVSPSISVFCLFDKISELCVVNHKWSFPFNFHIGEVVWSSA